jgi:hypothetical protein
MEPDSHVSTVSLHWWLWRDWSRLTLGFAPTMGSFIRLRAHYGKSQLWSHMPSPVSFHSLRGLLLLATQWPVRAPFKLVGGGGWGSHVEVLQFHSTTQSHWSNRINRMLPIKGSAVCVPGMHPHSQWSRFLVVTLSRYNLIIITGQALPGNCSISTKCQGNQRKPLDWVIHFIGRDVIVHMTGMCIMPLARFKGTV